MRLSRVPVAGRVRVPVSEVDVGRVERLAIGTSSRFIFTSRLRVAQRNALGMPMNDSSPTQTGYKADRRGVLQGEKTRFGGRKMRSLENGSEDSLGRLEIPRVGGECAGSAVGIGIGVDALKLRLNQEDGSSWHVESSEWYA